MDLPRALPDHKRVAAFFLLPACDIRCTFCISHNSFDSASEEKARALMGVLAESSIDSVVLGGGEPTLWPGDVNALAGHAQSLDLVTQLNTHGGGLLENLERYSNIDRFILPIESHRPAVHDNLRRGWSGHHAMILELVEALLREQRTISFATVITAENHGDVLGMASWMSELQARGARIHAWHLYNFLPEGRGGAGKLAANLACSRAEFLRACTEAKGADLGFPVYRRDNMLESSTVEFLWFEQGTLCMGGEDLTGRGSEVRRSPAQDADAMPEAMLGLAGEQRLDAWS